MLYGPRISGRSNPGLASLWTDSEAKLHPPRTRKSLYLDGLVRATIAGSAKFSERIALSAAAVMTRAKAAIFLFIHRSVEVHDHEIHRA